MLWNTTSNLYTRKRNIFIGENADKDTNDLHIFSLRCHDMMMQMLTESNIYPVDVCLYHLDWEREIWENVIWLDTGSLVSIKSSVEFPPLWCRVFKFRKSSSRYLRGLGRLNNDQVFKRQAKVGATFIVYQWGLSWDWCETSGYMWTVD